MTKRKPAVLRVVLHVDDQILVVNKPAGLLTVPARAPETTLIDVLRGMTDFAGLAFEDVIDALDAAGNYLDVLSREVLDPTNPDVKNPLAAALPTINRSPPELLNFAGRFRQLIAGLRDEPIVSSDQLQPLLTQALGLSALPAIGFNDGQNGTSITAGEAPISFVLNRDVQFLLTVGGAPAVSVVVLSELAKGGADPAHPGPHPTLNRLSAHIPAASPPALRTCGPGGASV